jgi:hypothetical protein
LQIFAEKIRVHPWFRFCFPVHRPADGFALVQKTSPHQGDAWTPIAINSPIDDFFLGHFRGFWLKTNHGKQQSATRYRRFPPAVN